jgi:hypothetical protein
MDVRKILKSLLAYQLAMRSTSKIRLAKASMQWIPISRSSYVLALRASPQQRRTILVQVRHSK